MIVVTTFLTSRVLGVSLRLGHAHVLTVHRTVIHYARVASLRRPLQKILNFSVGANCVRPPLCAICVRFGRMQENSASLRGKFASQNRPSPTGWNEAHGNLLVFGRFVNRPYEYTFNSALCTPSCSALCTLSALRFSPPIAIRLLL